MVFTIIIVNNYVKINSKAQLTLQVRLGLRLGYLFVFKPTRICVISNKPITMTDKSQLISEEGNSRSENENVY